MALSGKDRIERTTDFFLLGKIAGAVTVSFRPLTIFRTLAERPDFDRRILSKARFKF